MKKAHLISVKQALKLQQQGAEILDVRTAEEWSQGVATGALMLSLSDIQQQQTNSLDSKNTYLLICEKGQRSIEALKLLANQGFSKLCAIERGFEKWRQDGLPISYPKISSNELRYQRHYQLQGFGRKAQAKLAKAHVVIVGVGGLGSSAAYYLTAAGVGKISLIDDDKVSLSNLQRQILHSNLGLRQAKVESAKNRLNQLNPETQIQAIQARLDYSNAKDLIATADVVIDASDNLATRYLINDVCLNQRKKLVYASVFEYEAQLTSFDFSVSGSPCLRCLFPQMEAAQIPNCSTVGVLGVVPGFAGVLQASETIKILTGVGQPLFQKLQVMNVLDNSFYSFAYKTDPDCKNHH